ncbi:MAG: PAS domain S-box protein [Dehalococcoidales bacterium]|nr:MAG: PAS domain S-box protein [Dehalococcoidales bacterium]
MSLKTRILLIISVVFIFAIGLIYAVSRLTFIRGLEEIEEQNTSVQVKQTVDVFEYLINDLEADTADWAAWDDTYKFIQDRNQEYILSNLVDETFINLRLSVMLYIDQSGNVVYNKAYDIEGQEEIKFPSDLLNQFTKDSSLLSRLDQHRIISGILEVEQGLMIVAAQPILTSENEGPALGTLVFARLLNESTINELSGLVHYPISLLPIDSVDSREASDAISSIQAGKEVAVLPRDDDTIVGYSLVNDIYDNAEFVLRVEIPRETYQLGEKVSSYYILSVLGVGILVGFIAWLLLQRRILSRIALLIRGVDRIAETGDTSIRIGLTGSDEVSVVAGTIDGMLGALEEVGKEVRESENRYRLLADNVMDVIWSTDKDFYFTYISPSIIQLTGFTVEEMLGKNLRDQLDEDTLPAALKAFGRESTENAQDNEGTIGSSPSYETQLTKKDGTKIWTEIRLTAIKDVNKETIGYVGVARDISERHQAEQLYRTLANSSTVGVYIYQDGVFKFVNPQFAQLTGYTEEELMSMRPGDIVYPDERAKARENAIKMLKGESYSPYEFQVIHPSGEPHWAMETVSSIEYNGKRATLGNFMDITESKLARQELEKLYAQERQLRESLEEEIQKRIEFTRALVHELKTPITPVLAAVELLMEEMSDTRLARLVGSIDRSANNLNLRIDELLDLARGETDMLRIELEIVDTHSVFNDVGYEMIPLALRNKQVLNFELPESLPPIEADRSRLRQIVMNLLNNAFKFTPEGGTVTLRASSDDENLIVEVEDTGPGINKEDLEKLFEPYFRRTTDRDRLSGLGLGLALAKNFVELHGGRIWVESSVGKGSTFHFTLPIRQNDNRE